MILLTRSLEVNYLRCIKSLYYGLLVFCITIIILLYLAPIIGHVGDGNFHSLIIIDPSSEQERTAAKDLAFRMAKYIYVVTTLSFSNTIYF